MLSSSWICKKLQWHHCQSKILGRGQLHIGRGGMLGYQDVKLKKSWFSLLGDWFLCRVSESDRLVYNVSEINLKESFRCPTETFPCQSVYNLSILQVLWPCKILVETLTWSFAKKNIHFNSSISPPQLSIFTPALCEDIYVWQTVCYFLRCYILFTIVEKLKSTFGVQQLLWVAHFQCFHLLFFLVSYVWMMNRIYEIKTLEYSRKSTCFALGIWSAFSSAELALGAIDCRAASRTGVQGIRRA